MSTDTEDAVDAVVIENQGEAKEHILKFLTKIRSSMENEGTIRVQLLHLGPTTDRLIGVYPYTFGDVQEVCKEIIDKAVEYSEHQPTGKVKFSLQARVGANAQTQNFSLKVQQDGDDDYELEPATDEGREAQRMKYTLQLQKQNLDTTKVAIRASQMPTEMLYRMIEMLEQKNAKLETRLERADAIREQLLDGQQARDLAYDEYKHKKMMQQKALSALAPSAQLLVAHLAGAPPEVIQQMMQQMMTKTLGPSRPAASESSSTAPSERMGKPSYEEALRVFDIVERLFSGPNALTKDQVLEMLPILSMEQQSNLGELHTEVLTIRERGPRAPEPEPATKTNGTNGGAGAAYTPFSTS